MTSKSSELARHWPLIAVCAIGIGIGVASLPFYTQGLFIEAWIAEFGWNRTEASLGIMASTLALAAISPFVGAAVDRYGLVRPISVALIGLTVSFMLFATLVQSVTSFIVISITMAVLAGASSPLAYTRAINAVFDRQRGLALGITLCGTGLGAALAPPIVSDLIATQGWRGAYWALAGFTAIAGLVIVLVLARIVSGQSAGSNIAEPSRADFLMALKGSTYWLLLAAFFLLALGFGGLIVHFVPILMEFGMAGDEAARIAGIIGVAVIIGRVSIGAIIDRIFAPRVAACVILLCLSGAVMLATWGSVAAYPAAFVIGFAIGAEVDLIGYLVARYFGMRAYGKLYGFQYAAFLVGTGLSPVLVGLISDATGDYVAAIYTAAAVMALSALLFLQLPKFQSQAGKDML